jgi:hypothetical protein
MQVDGLPLLAELPRGLIEATRNTPHFSGSTESAKGVEKAVDDEAKR